MRKKSVAMILAFLLIFQYMNFNGYFNKVEAAGTIPGTILTKMTLTPKDQEQTVIASVYQGDDYVNTEYRVQLEKELKLSYEWALPENHSYSAGDTFVFQLPDEMEMYNDIPVTNLAGDPSVGTFQMDKNTKTVTMTFNDEINAGTPSNGTLSFWSKFTSTSVQQKTEVKVKFAIGDEITIPIAPSNGTPINKNGQADKPFNATKITWTVDVNTDLKNIKSGVVTDNIPAGLTYVPGSIKVYQMDINTNGTLSNPMLITPNAVTEPAGASTELKVELGDINRPYRLVFETDITDITKANFTNTAKFTGNVGGNNFNVQAPATVQNQRGKFLDKSGSYNESTQEINWTVKYNFGEDPLAANTVLTDLFDKEHSIDLTSIHVYPVANPVAGTKGTELNNPADYTVNTNVSSHPNYNANKNGFNVVINAASSSAYIIEYKTKPTGNIYNNDTISNKAYSIGKESNGVNVDIKQHFLSKTHGNVNYAARTVDWTIHLNKDKYVLYNTKFKDEFPAGLKLVPGSLTVKQNGTTVTNSVYTLNYLDALNEATEKGFEILLPDGNSTYTITYTTQYDFIHTSYFSNSNFNFGNKGTYYWSENSDGSNGQNQVVTETFTPNNQTQWNGYKEGAYNAVSKTLTWGIGVNYNSKAMSNVSVADELQHKQAIDLNTLKVFELTVNANGGVTKSSTEFTDYTHNVVTLANGNQELTVTFNNPINRPYYITFDTSMSGVLIDQNVPNKAILKGDGYANKELDSTVTIKQAGEYVAKSGQQSGATIKWKIDINRGQSTVDDAKIIDVPGKKQTLIKESFKLYQTVVDAQGNVTRGALITDPDDPQHGYTLTFTPITDGSVNSDETFELSFKHQITKPYWLEYESMIDATNGEKVTNNVKFTGSGGIEKSISNPSEVTVSLSGGEGTGNTYRGSLKIVKVDSENNATKLNGAKFELIRNSNGQKVTGETTGAGEYVFTNLLYGKYTLNETGAPSGYAIDTVSKAVTINSTTEQELIVTNTKLKSSLEVTKVDTDNTNVKLDGAVFELYNSSNALVDTQTTVSGKAVFSNLPYGTYTLKEVTAPTGYDIIASENNKSITINALTVKAVTVKNSKSKGSLVVTKVDADDSNVKLQGAVFELYNSSNVKVDQQTTNGTGKATFSGLEFGTYTLKETSAPAGYEINASQQTSTVTITAAAAKDVTITNSKSKGSLEVTKVDGDNTNTKLSGAVFELYNSSNVKVDQQTTDANGKATFSDLVYGTYTLKETAAPAGYDIIASENNQSITINTLAAKTVTVKNSKSRGSLVVTKVDVDDNSVKLAGAVFELYNSANVKVDQQTTDATGKAVFSSLLFGTYTLKEVSAPAGYEIIASQQTSTVTIDSTTAKDITITNTKPKGSLEITKVDVNDSTKKLEGAVFELYNSSNVKVGQQTTDASGKATFSGLLYGTYTLKEVAAPAGYRIIEAENNKTVTINSHASAGITVTNSRIILPPNPSPSPSPSPSASPSPSPSVDPSPTPSATPGPSTTPSVTPSTAPSATPGTQPSATPKPSNGPSTTPPVERETTPKDTPIEGEIEIPDGSIPTQGIPPEHGKVTIGLDGKWVYTPDKGYVGKDRFSIIVTDEDGNEEEIWIEIDVLNPLGGLNGSPDVNQLPKTGESSYLGLQLFGIALIALGAILFFRRKSVRGNRS
ncbi:SpaA isopeptide-forming pilin-related protein [Paenibacillus gorillae]|uniref:SpaA isopeptide-forming pilin-related protein n=1 Tax=Paenibacillus gorillae TaxID=1243662 RepID=UPI0004B89D29|nr:SpaA isopeptide-forming pilin-related protein [Paenibacillus gorillae]